MHHRTRREFLLSADLRPVPGNRNLLAVLFYVDRSAEIGVLFPHSLVFLSRN